MAEQYNILWIDDEHEKLAGFKLQAFQNNIILHPFKSLMGVDELAKNPHAYDGILLDAKFLESEDDVAGSEDLSSLMRAKEKLLQLPRKFEISVLTGQAQLFEDKTFNTFVPKYYRKGIADDIERLFADLKTAANKQQETQIRHEYSRVFEVCNKKYIGSASSKYLLAILNKETTLSAFTDPDIYFTPLRKVMEDLFIACNNYGFLPDIFIKGNVALNESSKFLSGGTEKGYKLDSQVFPKIIADSVRNILAVCQPASHRSEIDAFITKVGSPYLLLSVTYQLLDVLLWFKMHADENGNIEVNKSHCKQIEAGIQSGITTGKIDQDGKGNYHCGEVILTYKHVNDNGYKVGDEIRITKTANNSNEKTKDVYSKSSISSEKLNGAS